MITSHADPQQFKAAWGMYSFPLVISILSIVQLVRYRHWLFLAVEIVALLLLTGSIFYLAQMTQQLGARVESPVLVALLMRAVFLACAAYVLVNLSSYIMLVINPPL